MNLHERLHKHALSVVLAAALSLGLSGCGLGGGTEPLHVEKVSFPATIGATEPLTVTVDLQIWNCGEKDQTLTLAERTPARLGLSGTFRKGWAGPCSAAVVQKTLTYTDSGTPARTGPFEIVVNGKSWGTVTVR